MPIKMGEIVDACGFGERGKVSATFVSLFPLWLYPRVGTASDFLRVSLLRSGGICLSVVAGRD